MKNITKHYQDLVQSFEELELSGNIFVFQHEPHYRSKDYLLATLKALAESFNRTAFEYFREHELMQGSMEMQTPILDADDFFQISYHEVPESGEAISYQEFIGDEQNVHKKIAPDTWSIPDIDGLRNAILYPPQIQSETNFEQRQALFLKLTSEFIRRDDDLLIQRWDTDFCNYFDEGEEWWGSFLWTIENKTRAEVWVLLFSGTD